MLDLGARDRLRAAAVYPPDSRKARRQVMRMNAPELGPVTWRKSTGSGANGNCIECADLGTVVAVRDSKDPGAPSLTFATPGEHSSRRSRGR